jgi:hypothetical protein
VSLLLKIELAMCACLTVNELECTTSLDVLVGT